MDVYTYIYIYIYIYILYIYMYIYIYIYIYIPTIKARGFGYVCFAYYTICSMLRSPISIASSRICLKN